MDPHFATRITPKVINDGVRGNVQEPRWLTAVCTGSVWHSSTILDLESPNDSRELPMQARFCMGFSAVAGQLLT